MSSLIRTPGSPEAPGIRMLNDRREILQLFGLSKVFFLLKELEITSGSTQWGKSVSHLIIHLELRKVTEGKFCKCLAWGKCFC
ncbi:hypothetical protein L345_17154, partial [Ophiophagus hannah]